MATSNLVQFLESVDNGGSLNTSNRRQIETFIAKEAIAAGASVAFDYAATEDGDVTLGVYTADGNSSPVRTPFGVALAVTSSGDQVQVCISGTVDALVSDNGGAGMAIGTLLTITNTAGVLDLASAASAQPVVAILAETVAAAAGSTLKRVVVRKSF